MVYPALLPPMRTPRLASIWLNWRPRQFKWTRLFRLKRNLVSARVPSHFKCPVVPAVDSSWNVMAHGDERKGKWRWNWRMQWVASTLHTTSEHGVSNCWCAHLGWPAVDWTDAPLRFKWTSPFIRKTKSGFGACAITFQLDSTLISVWLQSSVSITQVIKRQLRKCKVLNHSRLA